MKHFSKKQLFSIEISRLLRYDNYNSINTEKRRIDVKRKRAQILLGTFILLVLMVTLSSLSFAEEVNKVTPEVQKQYLLEKGCSRDFLNSVTDYDILNNLYCKVYKHCEEDGLQLHVDKQVEITDFYGNSKSAIQTSPLKLIFEYIQYTDKNNMVTETDISVVYEWLSTPVARGTDELVFSFDSSKYVIDTENFVSWNHTTSLKTGARTSFNYNYNIAKYTNGSIGWFTKLKDPSYLQTLQVNPGGTALITLHAKSPLTQPVNVNIDLEYSHSLTDSGLFSTIETIKNVVWHLFT